MKSFRKLMYTIAVDFLGRCYLFEELHKISCFLKGSGDQRRKEFGKTENCFEKNERNM